MAQQLTFPDMAEPPSVSPREKRIAALRARRAAAKAAFDRSVLLCNTQAQRANWEKLRDATHAALRGRA